MIRRMTEADLTTITWLDAHIFGLEAWTRSEFEHEIADPHRYYLVASGMDSTNGFTPAGEKTEASYSAILGYTGVWTGGEGSAAYLLTLAVAPSARHSGVGTALITSAVRIARKARCRQIRLEVRVDNLEAIRLYTKLGFTRIGYEPHYYQPEDVDAYVMAHSLVDSSPADQV